MESNKNLFINSVTTIQFSTVYVLYFMLHFTAKTPLLLKLTLYFKLSGGRVTVPLTYKCPYSCQFTVHASRFLCRCFSRVHTECLCLWQGEWACPYLCQNLVLKEATTNWVTSSSVVLIVYTKIPTNYLCNIVLLKSPHL